MAGEKIGKTYEAILKVVLDRINDHKKYGEVFWNQTPAGISVTPDFSLGSDKDHPSVVILVTHYGTSGASHKKTWRNVGELCELKTYFDVPPLVYNIIFDSIMKDGMKTMQSAIFDGQIIVGDSDIGPALSNWVTANADCLPTEQEEKALCISMSKDKELKKLLSVLQDMVSSCIGSSEPALQQLWEIEHSRPKHTEVDACNTHFRHGYAKRLLVGEALLDGRIKEKDGMWLSKLQLAKKRVGGYYVSDEDLIWFLNTEYADRYQSMIERYLTYGFKLQMIKVRSFAILETQCDFVIENFKELCTSEGMRMCLISQHDDPYGGIDFPSGLEKPVNMWIYDFVAALVRARAKKVHAFGYSAFSHHPHAADKMVGSATLGDWCSRFINQYFARNSSFQVPDGAVEFVAMVLAEQLSSFTEDEIIKLKDEIIDQFIAKEYTATYLAHRGFDPLLVIMIDAGIVGSPEDRKNIRSCFAEKAGLDGQAGKTTVLHVNNTIINWQTATDAGKDHKRKELCGRAVGLRYTWNAEKKCFTKRPGVEKMILLADGTWSEKDLSTLINSGWDEIYYPNEIAKLKAAII